MASSRTSRTPKSRVDLSELKLLGPYGMNVFDAMTADATSTKRPDDGVKVGAKPCLKGAMKSGIKEGIKIGTKVGVKPFN